MTDTPLEDKKRDQRPMRPIRGSERIELIDILRGIALFGILLINIRYIGFPMLFEDYYVEMYPSVLDSGIRFGLKILVYGKFFSLFSFLFGLGMAVQMNRALQTKSSFGLVYSRRLLILLVIGLIHDVFIWYGLILTAYALMGFVLLAIKRLNLRAMLVLAGMLVFVPPVATWFFYGAQGGAGEKIRAAAGSASTEAAAAARQEAFEEDVELFREGSYTNMISFRITQLGLTGYTLMLHGWYILAMFMFGFWSWQKGIWSRPEQQVQLPFFTRLLWSSLALAVLGSTAVVICPPQNPPIELGWSFWIGSLGDQLARCSLCAFYIAATVLVYHSGQWWRRLLSPLAAVGRTAFSNYILQSIICTMIFYSYGLGLYSTTGPLTHLGLAALVFCAQVLISGWWLRHFRFGPAEWLWRSLTYGRLAPIKR